MGGIESVSELTIDSGVAVLTIDSPPVNALSVIVREAIAALIDQVVANPDVDALVLRCAGRTFFTGADISEFGQRAKGRSLPELVEKIENTEKPIVAAIQGNALGGGLEVALAAHYRVATANAKLGLPEIKLGLIPGAGGTVRLPRIIGVERALELITSGAPVDARWAQEVGAIDLLVDEQDELVKRAVAFARDTVARSEQRFRKTRDLKVKMEDSDGTSEVFGRFRAANARRYRGSEAFHKAIQAVQNSVELPFEDTLAAERRMFMELLNSSQSQAQRYLFFAERAAGKVPETKAASAHRIEVVGIIGAGTMGTGIAMTFMNSDIPLTIVESNKDALERGIGAIRRNYETMVKKGRIAPDDIERKIRLLAPTLDIGAIEKVDLVIEAVFEDIDLKRDVFRRVDSIAKADAILASNTSYLNINAMAEATARPESMLGLHFFSPANVMPLLEVVRGAKTAAGAIATAMELGKRIGKVSVLVGACEGFVGNRMLAKRQLQASPLMMEGASPWQIDRVLYEFGFPMGPFAMNDLAGLDLGWSKEKSSSSTIREVLCEMGRRGQKTHAGFHDYDAERNPRPSPLVDKIILEFAVKRGMKRRPVSDEEIRERCVFSMINEGIRILEERIALRASDIDVVWVNGFGWPSYRGGPMFYAESVGLQGVLKKLEDFESKFGGDFAPSARLRELVAEGKQLQDLTE